MAPLVTAILRPDRLSSVITSFVQRILGFDLQAASAHDLYLLITQEIKASSPVILASVKGFDAAFRIDTIVRDEKLVCTSVAMGSPEGFVLADQAINTAARTGQWVLLKNCHVGFPLTSKALYTSNDTTVCYSLPSLGSEISRSAYTISRLTQTFA